MKSRTIFLLISPSILTLEFACKRSATTLNLVHHSVAYNSNALSFFYHRQIIDRRKSKAKNTEWKTIGVKVRLGELPLLNRQLARFNYNTLGDLVKGLIPHIELLKLSAHKRSWILQAIKRFGDYYYTKYNNREVVQLIREIIERYDLNRDLDMKDRIYLVSPLCVEENF